MTNEKRSMRILAFLALATLLLPAATAQILSAQVGQFGTQVRAGDADYFPLVKSDPVMPQVAEYDFGIPGDVNDNCILLLNNARVTTAATVVPINKDLRLTPCQGKDAGTQIGDMDTVEKVNVYTAMTQGAASTPNGQPTTSFQYGDVNNNGKYDKGDFVYLTTKNVAGVPAAGLESTTGTGAWTLRMTPAVTYPAGSFVHNGDADFNSYQSGAKIQAFSLVEREDKGWYLIPVKASALVCGALAAGAFTGGFPASGSVKVCDESSAPQYKNGFIPANSLRIGLTSTFTLQPNVLPIDATLANPDAVEAGKPFPVIVTVTNNGGDAGVGLLVSKINGQILDARMTPKLSPGEQTKILVNVLAPATGGAYQLEVNDIFTGVQVNGSAKGAQSAAPGSGAASDATIKAMQSQIDQLKARLDAQPATKSVDTSATKASAGAPALELVALVAVVAAVGFAMRRRSE